MNELLVDKEALRLKYKQEFGREIPVSIRWSSFEIQWYINWLESIASEAIKLGLLK